MNLGYARISTKDQTLQQQVEQLTAAGCERVYSEQISGGRAMKSRPEWLRLSEALRPGDVVTVVRMDRLGRSLHDLLELLADLKERGVKVVSLSEEFGTGPAADLMLHIAAAFAQYERSLISERTREKLTSSRARGRLGGREKKLTGAADVQAVLTLYNARNASVAYIAQHFKVSRSTIYRVLSDAEDSKAGNLTPDGKKDVIVNGQSDKPRDDTPCKQSDTREKGARTDKESGRRGVRSARKEHHKL